jgi:ABC-type transport system involved in multi-copper enzyme maturation permease subunit
MFKALLIKEWKEKASLAVFGLGLMIIFLAAFLIFGNDQDLRDLIPAGFLIIFFPFLGLILGAGAFESEFRDGAWAYLLSRPVRKETVWLAKLVAPLSIMAGFWLVFLGLMAAVPGLGDVVLGFTYPGFVETGLAFFPLILLSSVFYFSVAFSLSILSERQFSLVFGSFFLGLALQGVLFFFAFQAGGRDLLTHAGRFPLLDAFEMALALTSLAFLGASLVTFCKADFSQPKKKTLMLARFSVIFLAVAWLLSAAWPSLRPGPKEEISSEIEIAGGNAIFTTTRGFYRYDIVRDKMDKIVRWSNGYPRAVIGGGRVLYIIGGDLPDSAALMVVNADGSEKRMLAGGKKSDARAYAWFTDLALSPDGKTAVYFYEEINHTSSRARQQRLASVRTDGSGSPVLYPLDPALAREENEFSWIRIVAWLERPDRLLLTKRSQTGATSLWTSNLATGAQNKLFESPGPAQFFPSPGGDVVLVISRKNALGPFEVSLLDTGTAESSAVMTIDKPRTSVWSVVQSPAWSPKGDEIVFMAQRNDGSSAPVIYLRRERRLVMPGDIRIKSDEKTMAPSLRWIDDTKLLLAAPHERALKILGSGLAVERTLSIPDRVGERLAAWSVDDSVLLTDFDGRGSVWRLDLKTEKWKRIW